MLYEKLIKFAWNMSLKTLQLSILSIIMNAQLKWSVDEKNDNLEEV